jgi:hypothetical protein
VGEFSSAPLLLDFDARLRLEFRSATISSDAGLLALRELDDALGLTRRASEFLSDARTGLNISHQFSALLRQSLFSRIAGYEDTNDADRLSSDPTLRLVTGRFDPKRSAASSRTLGRFEADVLAREENLSGLSRLNASWIKRALELTAHKRVILDLDSSVSPRARLSRGLGLQRPLPDHLLSPALPLQSVGRVRRSEAASGQRLLG